MTARVTQMLLTLVSGSALAIAPMAFATVITPAASNADECSAGGSDCGQRDSGLNCPDGTVVDEENAKCVDLMSGISKQLQALPAPPSLSGFGGGGGGGVPGLGGFPSLGTINAPDLVLPSFGIDLVPDLSVNPNLGLGGVFGGAAAGAAANALPQLPAPQLAPPDLTKLPSPQLPKVNPLNPLGLPPPPDLTPGIPFI
jgi:hypothetical protein